MADFNLGLDAILYYDTYNVEPTTQEVINVRDQKVSIKVGMAESSSRLSIWKNKKATLAEGDASFTIVYDGTNQGHMDIRDACLDGTMLSFKFLGLALDGIWGNFTVSGFDTNQPLTDGQSVDVKLELDGAPTLVEVPA